MKPTILTALLWAGLPLLALAQTDLATNHADLSQWLVSGADKQELVRDDGLYLPPGAQLYRAVSAGGLTLSLISVPEFAVDSAEVPLLELGTTALAFVREDHSAKLKLVRENHDPESLPVSWDLDESSHLAEPLSLEITLRGAALMITAQHQVLTFAVEPPSAATEIVFSSGATQGWPIRNLVLNTEPFAETSDPGSTSSDDGTQNPVPAAADPMAGVPADAGINPGEPGSTTEDSPATDQEKGTDLKRHRVVMLEVFTPPAVRRSRTAEVRASLNTGNQK